MTISETTCIQLSIKCYYFGLIVVQVGTTNSNFNLYKILKSTVTLENATLKNSIINYYMVNTKILTIVTDGLNDCVIISVNINVCVKNFQLNTQYYMIKSVLTIIFLMYLIKQSKYLMINNDKKILRR